MKPKRVRLNLLFEAGHGRNYRQQHNMDMGAIAEDGSTEHDICSEYAKKIANVAHQRFHFEKVLVSGGLDSRLKIALATRLRVTSALISVHMSVESPEIPGGKILYHTDRSGQLANLIAAATGLPVERVDCPPHENVMLLFDPCVEIQLGNIQNFETLRTLRSSEYAYALGKKVMDALEEMLVKKDIHEKNT